jgi:peroxiredoxin
VEELPSLNRLGRRYADSPFAVLSVDFQESAEHIKEFIGRIPLDFPVLLDADGRTSLDWRVFSFPSSFLIDRQGRIRYSVNRAIDWETPEVWEVVDELLGEEGR